MIFVSFLYSACRGILIGASGVWMRDISRNTSRCFKPAVVDERVCIAFRRALSYKSFQFVVFMRNIANAALGRLESLHTRRGREWSDRWILSMVALLESFTVISISNITLRG